jgi:hypothetical protein
MAEEELKDLKKIENDVSEIKKIRPLIQIYVNILGVISNYMDIPEEDNKIIALWVMCASCKNSFITFPFLFINASKGSGKTRLLKLLEAMIPRSQLTPNLTEASLIRLPSQENLNALLIDEAERLGSKEKHNLRELLNQAYKKGGKILRVEEDGKRNRIVKGYDVFMAIALANIWGLESILEDRCITITLEKSNNPFITKIPEFFELDERIINIKKDLDYVGMYEGCTKINAQEYLYHILKHIPTSYTTYTTYTTYIPELEIIPEIDISKDFNTNIDFFVEEIKNSSLLGRELELWLPLLTMSACIDKEFFIQTLNLAERRSKEKTEMDIMEDRDVIFSMFLYYYLKANNIQEMIQIKEIKNMFNLMEDRKPDKKDWFSNEWIGRCLKRINIIKNKKRMTKGIEVEINIDKLKEYLTKRRIEIKEEDIKQYKEDEKIITEEKQTTL